VFLFGLPSWAALHLTGISAVDHACRSWILASFSLRSGARVQAVRSAPVLAKASPKPRLGRRAAVAGEHKLEKISFDPWREAREP
jgi:hypothetical protein